MLETNDDALGLDPADALTNEECARVLADIVRHSGDGMTKEELETAFKVVLDDYRMMMLATAWWRLWREGAVSFGVKDDEIVMHPEPA